MPQRNESTNQPVRQRRRPAGGGGSEGRPVRRKRQPQLSATPVGKNYIRNDDDDVDFDFSFLEEEKNKASGKSRVIGLAICAVQLLATAIFVFMLFHLHMLPLDLFMAAAIILVFLWIAPFVSQMLAKGKGIVGKVISGVLTIFLVIGIYFSGMVDNTIEAVAVGEIIMTDRMVVAVRYEDTAQSLEDTRGYTFGVQYAMRGNDIRMKLHVVREHLEDELEVIEFNGLAEQVDALLSGDVQAIIYNEAFNGLLSETHPSFMERTRIIYLYEIEVVADEEMEERAERAAAIQVEAEPFALFISGIDIFGPISLSSRSDANILAVVNPATQQILLVNTPRDFFIEIPGVTNGQLDKLTHAGLHGINASMAAIEKLYDVEIPFFVRLNFTSLIQIVDALGGITVYSEYAFNTSDGAIPSFFVAQGANHLNGDQALAFSRERMNLPGGDLQRGRNHQAVIAGVLRSLMSPAIITGAGDILDSVAGNVDTNMSQEQVQNFIRSQLVNGFAWNIKNASAEGTLDYQFTWSIPQGQSSVIWPDHASIHEIQRLIDAVEAGVVFTESEVLE